MKDFDWEGPDAIYYFEITAKYGFIFYIKDKISINN